jgi:hypothetical protein
MSAASAVPKLLYAFQQLSKQDKITKQQAEQLKCKQTNIYISINYGQHTYIIFVINNSLSHIFLLLC